jgi:hypothetical protein
MSTHNFDLGTKMFPEINKEIFVAVNEWRIATCGCCNFSLRTQIEA